MELGSGISACFSISNPNNQSLAKGFSSATNCVQRNCSILRIEQTIKLRAASTQFFGEGLFCCPLFPHGFCKLPRNHTLDRNCLDFLSDALFFEETVKTRSSVLNCAVLFLCIHCDLPCFFLFRRASSKSSSGIFRVFLMNPCKSTIRPFLSK